MDFMDFGKEYDRVNKEALWQVLRMHDVGGKLLNGFKSMDVNSLACVIVNGGKNECSRIDWGVRHGYIMSPWLHYIQYMDAVMKMKMGKGRRGIRFQ